MQHLSLESNGNMTTPLDNKYFPFLWRGWLKSNRAVGGSPWTGLQTITGLTPKCIQTSMHTLTSTDHLEPWVNLTSLFWTVGGSWCTWNSAHSLQRGPPCPNWDFDCCGATVPPTVPLYSPSLYLRKSLNEKKSSLRMKVICLGSFVISETYPVGGRGLPELRIRKFIFKQKQPDISFLLFWLILLLLYM